MSRRRQRQKKEESARAKKSGARRPRSKMLLFAWVYWQPTPPLMTGVKAPPTDASSSMR